MGKDKPKDDPLKKERERIERTERQIKGGSYACGCGESFGSALLLDIHGAGCDG